MTSVNKRVAMSHLGVSHQKSFSSKERADVHIGSTGEPWDIGDAVSPLPRFIRLT